MEILRRVVVSLEDGDGKSNHVTIQAKRQSQSEWSVSVRTKRQGVFGLGGSLAVLCGPGSSDSAIDLQNREW